jgi:hypothetical protein
MQAINRIQNAMINANAAVQGAMVVNGANAHRAYPSFKPCDTSPVSKCPGTPSSSLTSQTVVLSQRRRGLGLPELGRLTTGPVGKMWRQDSHQHLMPATLWATLVVNRELCG